MNERNRVMVVGFALPPKLPEKYDHEIETAATQQLAQCVAIKGEQANENEMT